MFLSNTPRDSYDAILMLRGLEPSLGEPADVSIHIRVWTEHVHLS